MLKQDQCIKIIELYDKNLYKPRELNSQQFTVIGSFFIYIGWLALNAGSVFVNKYRTTKSSGYFDNLNSSPQHAIMVCLLSSSVSVIVTFILFNKFKK